jgi:hypothetical protein
MAWSWQNRIDAAIIAIALLVFAAAVSYGIVQPPPHVPPCGCKTICADGKKDCHMPQCAMEHGRTPSLPAEGARH